MYARFGTMMRKTRRKSSATRCLLAFVVLVVLLTYPADSKGETTFRDFGFAVEPSDRVVVRDQPAVLDCVAVGDPKPTIDWIKDGVYLNFKSSGDLRRSILANGSLHFTSVHHTRSEKLDEGIYQCVASIENLGTIVSRSAKLQVASLPRYDDQPKDLSVFPGQTARFPCTIDAIPPANISWLKDEQPVHLDTSRMTILPSGAIEISLVQVGDEGSYRCNASNMDRFRLSQAGNLTVNLNTAQANKIAIPQFVATPRNMVVQEGHTVTLDCAANGNPRPRITWLKDGTTIDFADLDGRFFEVASGSLQIHNVQEMDHGVYMCRAENHEDSVDVSATLVVQVPPRFVKRPVNRFAYEKETMELECEVYGRPEPTVQWVKNGDPIIESEYFQFVNGHNLTILGLVDSDVGAYQCIASNPAGNIQASAQLLILRRDSSTPSTFVTTPLVEYDTTLGAGVTGVSVDTPSEPLDLVAVIISTRFVTLSWQPPEKPHGEILAYSVYYRQNSSLRERVVNTTRNRLEEVNIQGLKPATTYHFRVVAYNGQGPGRSSTELEVETKTEVRVPGQPQNLRATPTSPTKITVEWDAPEPNGPVQHYKVYYMEVGTSEEHEADSVTSPYHLSGLRKHEEYSIWVVAYNQNGRGLSTDEVVARTFSDVPSETPQNVTLEAASSTSIIIRWEPPPSEDRNGIITGYKIRYKQKGSKRGDTVTTDGNRRLYALTGLDKGAEYSVKISALTVNGTGPNTDWMTTETYQNDLDESKVPDSPSTLKARPNANSIIASWTPPRNQNIMVRGYTIGWGVGIPDVYTKVLDGKQRYYTIENLVPSSEYVISLRAYNQMGDGRPIYDTVKTRVQATALEPLPAMLPPVGLKAIVLSYATVVLMWTDTTLPKNQIVSDNRFYTIRYSTNQRYKYINCTELNYMIDDLKPNTQYDFSVKVVKGKRESTWSLSVLNTTYESMPSSPPRDVTVVSVESSPTSVILNWQPPKQPNGQITGYVIFYTTDNTQRDTDWVVEEVVGDKMTTAIRGLTPNTTYYCKIQARNNKGYGPFSPIVPFKTGPSSLMDVIVDVGSSNGRDGQGINQTTLYIIIACVVAIVLVIVIALAVVFWRKKFSYESGRKKSNYLGKGLKSKSDIKPPDLWIHHDQMELKQLDKSRHSDSTTTMTVTPIPREDLDSEDKLSRDTIEKRTPSYIGGVSGTEACKPTDTASVSRRISRHKPLSITFDMQQTPPKEPIATATPLPNGNLGQHSDRDIITPGRPVYPRTQYNISRAHVNMDQGQSGIAGNSPELLPSPGTYNQQIPMPYEQVAAHPGVPSHQMIGVAMGTGQLPSYSAANAQDPNMGTLGKRPPGHPLKSFSVPAPPPQSAPTTPQPKHIVRAQQTASPCKKPNPSSSFPANAPSTSAGNPSTQPLKSRTAGVPVILPRAPDAAYKNPSTLGREEKLAPSYSSEELTAEMAASLEGLMKDLNAITASEFEC